MRTCAVTLLPLLLAATLPCVAKDVTVVNKTSGVLKLVIPPSMVAKVKNGKTFKEGTEIRVDQNGTVELAVNAKDVREANWFAFQDQEGNEIAIKGWAATAWNVADAPAQRTYTVKIDGKKVTFTKY